MQIQFVRVYDATCVKRHLSGISKAQRCMRGSTSSEIAHRDRRNDRFQASGSTLLSIVSLSLPPSVCLSHRIPSILTNRVRFHFPRALQALRSTWSRVDPIV